MGSVLMRSLGSSFTSIDGENIFSKYSCIGSIAAINSNLHNILCWFIVQIKL